MDKEWLDNVVSQSTFFKVNFSLPEHLRLSNRHSAIQIKTPFWFSTVLYFCNAAFGPHKNASGCSEWRTLMWSALTLNNILSLSLYLSLSHTHTHTHTHTLPIHGALCLEELLPLKITSPFNKKLGHFSKELMFSPSLTCIRTYLSHSNPHFEANFAMLKNTPILSFRFIFILHSLSLFLFHAVPTSVALQKPSSTLKHTFCLSQT